MNHFSRCKRVKSTVRFTGQGLLLLALSAAGIGEEPDTADVVHPMSEQQRATLQASLTDQLKQHPKPQPGDPDVLTVHSKRGDALFFLGEFPEAVAEYRAMVSVDPKIDTSHWRLGIALFFADQSKAAVAQFEKYHSFDDVDRENGIWRYLSQYRATDGETAKKELLRYDKDDREPFPAVYQLFDDSLTPKEALAMIPATLSASEREKRLFYTELYIGMHSVVKKQPQQAAKYLALAVGRKWPRSAGFGPNYMWHVGRVQLETLLQPGKDDEVVNEDSLENQSAR